MVVIVGVATVLVIVPIRAYARCLCLLAQGLERDSLGLLRVHGEMIRC